MSTPTLHVPTPAGHVERYIDAWHQHHPDAVVALHTPDTRFTSAATGLEAHGHDELRAALVDLFICWPDLEFAPQRVYGDGDVVFLESIISVTQARPMTCAGIEVQPTGEQVQTTVVDLIHLREGLVANKHSYLDELGYLRAMGHTVNQSNHQR